LVALACPLSLGISVGRADVVAVVSSMSQITTLTRTQVMELPIDREEGSPARDEFYTRLAEMSPAQVKSFWARIIFTGRGQPPKTVATDVEAKRLLVADPNTIGYIDKSLVDSSVRVVLTP
jgi:hypothetical protein